MTKAKNGDNVKVHYKGKLTTGEQFDSSEGREPLAFTVGAGQMISGFDNAVEGMEVNEKKQVVLKPEEAYGPVNEDLFHQVERSQLPADLVPQVGQVLVAGGPNGQETQVVVREVHDQAIVIDANHPLAGQELTFDIELVAIG